MRRACLLLGLVALVGCSAASTKETPSRADTSPGEPTTIGAEPGYNRPGESKEQPSSPEPERAVTLPDQLELSAAPRFPERPRVAVAFVRGGKLVRRADALRRLAHDMEKDARIEALERFADDAPSTLALDQLCERAAKQGAQLLLIDARAKDEDAERTTYVLTAGAPAKALAFTRPRAVEPAGQELVARLVRTSRGS